MTAEDSLYAALTGAAAVTAIVSTRCYPDPAPPTAAVPCVVFARQGTEYLNTIHATSLGAEVTFDIYCLAKTREAADALADAVQAGIQTSGFEPVNRRTESDGGESESIEMTVVTVTFWEL